MSPARRCVLGVAVGVAALSVTILLVAVYFMRVQPVRAKRHFTAAFETFQTAKYMNTYNIYASGDNVSIPVAGPKQMARLRTALLRMQMTGRETYAIGYDEVIVLNGSLGETWIRVMPYSGPAYIVADRAHSRGGIQSWRYEGDGLKSVLPILREKADAQAALLEEAFVRSFISRIDLAVFSCDGAGGPEIIVDKVEDIKRLKEALLGAKISQRRPAVGTWEDKGTLYLYFQGKAQEIRVYVYVLPEKKKRYIGRQVEFQSPALDAIVGDLIEKYRRGMPKSPPKSAAEGMKRPTDPEGER